jgi:hypothetical protein
MSSLGLQDGDRSSVPAALLATVGSANVGVLTFSGARVARVPRDLVTRRVEVAARGAGLFGGIRVQAAARPADVIDFVLRPAFQFAVRVDGEPLVQVDASSVQ